MADASTDTPVVDDRTSSRIHISNLDRNFEAKDLEDAFSKFGEVTYVWVARNPAGFAFVDLRGEENVDKAIEALDHTELSGCMINVARARSAPGAPVRDRRGGDRDDRRRDDRRGDRRDNRRDDRGDDRDTKCYNCNGTGHFARECRQPRNGGECYTCRRPGHQQRDCPSNRDGPRGGRGRSYSPDRRGRGYSPVRRDDRGRGYSPVRRDRDDYRDRDHGRGGYRPVNRSPERGYVPVDRGYQRAYSPRRRSPVRGHSPMRGPPAPSSGYNPIRRSRDRYDSPVRAPVSPRGSPNDASSHMNSASEPINDNTL